MNAQTIGENVATAFASGRLPDDSLRDAVRGLDLVGVVPAVGDGAGGISIRIPGCIIGTIGPKGIMSMQEYVDSAHAAPLLEAMRAEGMKV